jgi:hypothetical protein
MTPQDQAAAERLLSQLEIAIGQFPVRDGTNAALLKTMLESVNGLRSLLGLVRTH